MPITNPSSISKVKAWWDATTGVFSDTAGTAAVTTDGSTIKCWTDRINSIKATNASSTCVLKTSLINSKNVVRFNNATTGTLNAGTPAALSTFQDASYSVWAVFKMVNASGSSDMIVSKGTGDVRIALGIDSTGKLVRGTAATPKFGAIPNTQVAIAGYTFVTGGVNTGTETLRIDGSQGVTRTGSVPAAVGDSWVIGSASNQTNYTLDGDILHIVLVEGELTSGELADLEGWFATETGLATTDNLIFDGDSLTNGGHVSDPDQYPEQTKALLLAARPSYAQRFYNLGVGGQTVTNMLSDVTTEVDIRTAGAAARNLLYFWEYYNEFNSLGQTGAQVYAKLVTYGTGRQGLFKRIVLGAPDTSFATQRNDLNTLLRADFDVATSNSKVFLPKSGVTWADAFIDLGADTTIGEAGDRSNLTYWQADTIHMTAAGYAIVAAYAKAAADILYPDPTPVTLASAVRVNSTTFRLTFSVAVSSIASINLTTFLDEGNSDEGASATIDAGTLLLTMNVGTGGQRTITISSGHGLVFTGGGTYAGSTFVTTEPPYSNRLRGLLGVG